MQHMDNITSLAAYGIRTQGLNAFFFAVTRLANPVFAFVMVALTSLLLYFRYAKRGLNLWFLLANAIGSLGINPLVKSIIQRQRPERAMPLLLWCSMGGVILILWVSCKASGKRHLATFGLGLIILVIGCSRIYLGVHYLSDILAGYSLGLSWLILSYGLFGPNPSSQTQLP